VGVPETQVDRHREQHKAAPLRAENVRLKQELAILKNGGVLREGCAVKDAWIASQTALPLSRLRAVLKVSIRG
jgi:hypothetical protein